MFSVHLNGLKLSVLCYIFFNHSSQTIRRLKLLLFSRGGGVELLKTSVYFLGLIASKVDEVCEVKIYIVQCVEI